MVETHAKLRVGHGSSAGEVRADEVALNEITRGVVGKLDTADGAPGRRAIAGNDVGRVGTATSDHVARRTFYPDAVFQVAQGRHAGDVDADVVTLNHIGDCRV